MTSLTIAPAVADDLDEAAVVLAEAFRLDPVLRAVVPEGRDRDHRLRELFRVTLAAGPFPTGAVDLARDDTGRIVGVAAWEGPAGVRGETRRYVRHLPTLLRALGLSGLRRAARISAASQVYRPRQPHWYLAEIGVSSRARGLGVGARLLTTRLDALDRMRLPAYLESSTPVNRRLYARLGFTELGAIPGIDGAEPVAMLRLPRAD
ncbi:GNAT family N-acetyltransferase [Microbacterium sp. T32]|uniref:GNAT family N-acetyltransferase n=2 Tax=Bacillati TaxID=1783272 RepID=UPI0007AB63BD|nr:GNAT family N-acetyltransferase [Microbacterium sp. T32]KZE39197.1 acetyltransferase [Microbacterium sp. T32]